MKIDRKLLAIVVVTGSTIIAAQSFAGSASVWGPVMSERSDAYVVPVVNDDQLKGNWKQFKGELKKKWADLTDDDVLYIEGRTDKLEGKIQERYGDKQEEVKKWVDEWFERHDTQGRSRTK
jgi:uncharacterized protein YjbJ (UPF0337 family)